MNKFYTAVCASGEIRNISGQARSPADELQDKDAEIAQLREALELTEWDTRDDVSVYCSVCEGSPETGHAADCIVGKALQQPSQAYERYQAMKEVVEAVKLIYSDEGRERLLKLYENVKSTSEIVGAEQKIKKALAKLEAIES